MDIFNNMKSMLLLFVLQFFIAGVFDESVSVKEGESVTLHSGLTGIETDDVIQWRFGPQGTLTAQINRAANKSITFDDVLEGRFRGRLKLDNQTGALTIRNIRTEHSGLYEVTSSKHSLNKIFNVSVVPVDDVKSVSVLVGDSVTLHTDLTEIQTDDEIQWRFEHQNSPIAEIDRKARKISTYDGPDGRFRHNLRLDHWTGSLTIRNIGISHSGLYEVDISTSSSKHTIHKSFIVMVSEGPLSRQDKENGTLDALFPKGDGIKSVSVMEEESVTLNTDAELQTGDEVLWMFGDKDTVIAKTKGGTRETTTSNGPDGRFRNRLKLDHQTGSLTITNTKTEHTGEYKLKITRSGNVSLKLFSVTLSNE